MRNLSDCEKQHRQDTKINDQLSSLLFCSLYLSNSKLLFLWLTWTRVTLFAFRVCQARESRQQQVSLLPFSRSLHSFSHSNSYLLLIRSPFTSIQLSTSMKLLIAAAISCITWSWQLETLSLRQPSPANRARFYNKLLLAWLQDIKEAIFGQFSLIAQVHCAQFSNKKPYWRLFCAGLATSKSAVFGRNNQQLSCKLELTQQQCDHNNLTARLQIVAIHRLV